MNEKIGCIYYDEEARQYSIVGPGIIVRCRTDSPYWIVEQSYGHNWEQVDVYHTRREAVLRMIHRAWELV